MRYRADIFTSNVFFFSVLDLVRFNDLLILRFFSNYIFFFQTVGFALALRQCTSIIIIRGRMPTFLPRHMIVWESGVIARRLIPIHITSTQIYQIKVKTTFNYLLAIVWAPHPRNIKLLAAGISKTGYILVQCTFCVNSEGFFDRNFTLVIIFLDVKCLVSTKRKFESLPIIIFI